jgi:phosphomannomutase
MMGVGLSAKRRRCVETSALAREFGVDGALEARDYTAALERLMPAIYDGPPPRQARARALRDAILGDLREAMRIATHPPKNRMTFGTSGWRGLLYDDFTIRNVACVTQGLVDTLLDPGTHAAVGVASVDDLRARGGVLSHDTRIMGPEFVEIASRVLLAHGIPVIDLGMATTPETSAALCETRAAFSINFTPSHNPFAYHGYKFNPADGGPATPELTRPVAARANEILRANLAYRALGDAEWEAARRDPSRYRREDPIALYRQSLAARLPWLDLPRLVERINASDIEIFVDVGFGAARGKYERLLEGVSRGKLHVFNDAEDYLFGGKSREPSVENFRDLQVRMGESGARLVVGFMNDGDGDRFVGGGRAAVLVMNKFGPIVVRYLVREQGLSGDVTRSVMTSHMADAARACYLPTGRLHETAVGFQYLKPFIAVSVNSWEESDGMSPQGWSRDKDGLLAALILTAMVLHYDRPAEAILAETEAELGTFYFERRKVSGRLLGAPLRRALEGRFQRYRPGDEVSIDGRAFGVAQVVTLDGTKVVLGEGWWFGVRPSGTEPVVRPYVETSAPPGASDAARAEARAWNAKIMAWLTRELEALLS